MIEKKLIVTGKKNFTIPQSSLTEIEKKGLFSPKYFQNQNEVNLPVIVKDLVISAEKIKVFEIKKSPSVYSLTDEVTLGEVIVLIFFRILKILLNIVFLLLSVAYYLTQ